jgi:hypothetical protein
MLPRPTNDDQLVALHSTLDELMRLCGGITTSIVPELNAMDKSVFQGRWVDQKTNETFNEEAIMVVADAPPGPEDDDLCEYLEALKIKCQHDFEQRIIWLTVQPVDRIASHDYV